MNYYFDTNIFRRYADDTITESDLQEFIRLASVHGCECSVTPITLVELGCRLTGPEALEFATLKKAFIGISKMCGKSVLPEPDALLRKLFLGTFIDMPEEDSWAIFCELVANAGTLDDITVRGIEFQKTGKRFRGRVDTSVLPKFRGDYEAEFIKSMWDYVIPNTSPGYAEYRKQGLTGGIRDKNLRKGLISLIRSEQFQTYFFDTLAARCGALLMGDSKNTQEVKKILGRLCAFVSAYQWILAKIAEAGYNFEKNKNDYADIHFLIYLLMDNCVFVTNDTHLRDKVDEKCPQRKRIVTFAEALNNLRIM